MNSRHAGLSMAKGYESMDHDRIYYWTDKIAVTTLDRGHERVTPTAST